MKTFKTFLLEEKVNKDKWKSMLSSTPELQSAIEVLNILSDFGDAYIVGGAVRDIVLGDNIDDVDIATNVPLEKIENLFTSHNIGKSKDFGIVTIKHNGHNFEVAQFRSDGNYTDGRRPDTIKIVKDFKDDASRRDFTINAMAIDKDGNIIDHFGGKKDIKNKVIKTVRDAKERFEEDKLRLLRAVRFAAKLGFELEPETKKAIQNMSGDITKVVKERIGKEFKKVAGYGGKKLAKFIHILDEVDMLDKILPELSKLIPLKHKESNHPEGGPFLHTLKALEHSDYKDAITNLAILFHDIGKSVTLGYKDDDKDQPTYFGHDKSGSTMFDSIAKKLDISNKEKEPIKFAIENHMKFHRLHDMNSKKIAKLIQDPNFKVLKDVAYADWMSRGKGHKQDEWERALRIIDKVRSNLDKFKDRPAQQKLVDGNDVMKWTGLSQGKELGNLIKDASEWVLDRMSNGIETTSDDIKEYILKIKN